MDRKGNHLRVFQSGAFHCIAHPNDHEHNRGVFAMVGVRGALSQDPEARRRRAILAKKRRQKSIRHASLRRTAEEHRNAIIANWPWTPADVWHDSEQIPDEPVVQYDAGWFIGTLFNDSDTIWTGKEHESGCDGKFASHWKTCCEWQQSERIGPMVTPCTYAPGTTSRAKDFVLTAPFTVLDFDGFDGIKPVTATEIQHHLLTSFAFLRWLREDLGWKLAAILHTGSVSLHAWFHTPSVDVLESLKITAPVFGIDAGLIGHPEHPCRLPGVTHHKTGNKSSVLWLKNKTNL